MMGLKSLPTRFSNLYIAHKIAIVAIISLLAWQSPISVVAQQQPQANKVADAEEYNNLGVDYYDKGEYNKAIQAFEQVLRINPNHAEAKEFLELAKQMKVQ